MVEHGFDEVERVAKWSRLIREAAVRSMIRPESLEQTLRDALAATYRKMVEKDGLLEFHPGIKRYTLEKVKPALRSELDRRIMASANLIKLNREQAIDKTIQRFQGWATSIPNGGTDNANKRETKENVRKALTQLPFEERRVLIDQGHKLTSAINEIVATDGGAIAGVWRSHWRQPGYNYREDHKDRDQRVFLVRDSWAHKLGYVKPARGVGYTDDVTKPAEEPFCRCMASDTEIFSAVGISVISRRSYDGPCLKIVTAALPERPLVVTPNHPVLTARGWVSADTLNVGDDLIEFVQQYVSPRVGVKNENNHPPTIAEIFDAAAKAFGIRSVRDSAMQFHGDGIADGNVDIVRPDRPLSFSVDSAKCRQQLVLTEADQPAFSFGSVREMIDRLFAACYGCAASFSPWFSQLLTFGLADASPTTSPTFALFEHSNLPLFRAALADLERRGGGVRPNFNPGLSQPTADSSVADLKLLCQRHSIAAGQIRAAKILGIKRERLSGHVYNLQTADEWYSAERIISHNCYYTYKYALRELPPEMITAKGKAALAAVRGEAKADTAHADAIEDGTSYQALDRARKLDRLGFLQGLKRIRMVPDHDEWNAKYEDEDDEIVLQEKFDLKEFPDKVQTLLHEAGHRGQARPLYDEFKRDHLNQLSSFVAIANEVHINDLAKTGKVDGGIAAEVFAESYARAMMRLPLPDALAVFWSKHAPAATGKLSPQAAEYIASWPNKVTRCQRCTMFIRLDAGSAKNGCRAVAGDINAHGHCRLFDIVGQSVAA